MGKDSISRVKCDKIIKDKSNNKNWIMFHEKYLEVMSRDAALVAQMILNRGIQLPQEHSKLQEDMHERGFVMCTVSYIQSRLKMSREIQKKALSELKKSGFAVVELCGNPARIRFAKINALEIEEAIERTKEGEQESYYDKVFKKRKTKKKDFPVESIDSTESIDSKGWSQLTPRDGVKTLHYRDNRKEKKEREKQNASRSDSRFAHFTHSYALSRLDKDERKRVSFLKEGLSTQYEIIDKNIKRRVRFKKDKNGINGFTITEIGPLDYSEDPLGILKEDERGVHQETSNGHVIKTKDKIPKNLVQDRIDGDSQIKGIPFFCYEWETRVRAAIAKRDKDSIRPPIIWTKEGGAKDMFNLYKKYNKSQSYIDLIVGLFEEQVEEIEKPMIRTTKQFTERFDWLENLFQSAIREEENHKLVW